ncbi:hypothetical protein BaRGS_00013289 [Batillaria attramentaria]|uniref:Uncharacterized protein n=1 Tax=Batillaria attramentaria TaxID=370345 RepID=A0ABD0L7M7_9CAEN
MRNKCDRDNATICTLRRHTSAVIISDKRNDQTCKYPDDTQSERSPEANLNTFSVTASPTLNIMISFKGNGQTCMKRPGLTGGRITLAGDRRSQVAGCCRRKKTHKVFGSDGLFTKKAVSLCRRGRTDRYCRPQK